MGLSGNLNTMSIQEVLAWIDAGQKSGTLEVARKNIVKRIAFRQGVVVGCSSNDPATLLGQFLLARGRISRKVLSDALRRQEASNANLGQILLEMGAISQADRDEFVEAKIEETIYGLFDWSDAVFRFHTEELQDPNVIEVDLEIATILQRGVRRSDEQKRSQEILNDLGIVLRRTGRTEPSELAGSRAGKRVFELIDGKKTLAEILLHSHAPEFLVKKFLTALLHTQVVEIQEVHSEPVTSEAPQQDPICPPVEPSPAASQTEAPEQTGQTTQPVPEAVPIADEPEPKRQYQGVPKRAEEESRELQAEINVALQLMSGGQPEAALELLEAMAQAHPGDASLCQLVVNAERDYCRKMLADELRTSLIPTRSQVVESGSEHKLSPEESFLLEYIDGTTDIQALLWVTPLRDVDALKTLSRMLKKGWIEFRKTA